MMQCAHAYSYGEVDPDIRMEAVNKPQFPPSKPVKGRTYLLVRNLACSMSPGDQHQISGRVLTMLPIKQFPYIPGKDVCGVVEDVFATDGSKPSGFKKGDVVCAFVGFPPHGGFAEYSVIQDRYAAVKPDNVPFLVGAACVDSAVTAVFAVEAAKIKPTDRVLVLGGSGGVGSVAVQLAKDAGAAFVASTSSQSEMLRALGVDMPINYKEQDWWTQDEFKRNPFDVLIDCVGGNQHWTNSFGVLKSRIRGGRFVAVVGEDPIPHGETCCKLTGFACRMLRRPLWSAVWPWIPNYITVMANSDSKVIANVLSLIEAGRLRIPLDPRGPLPFTAEGVKEAFNIQSSGHAHGKIVVKIADFEEEKKETKEDEKAD